MPQEFDALKKHRLAIPRTRPRTRVSCPSFTTTSSLGVPKSDRQHTNHQQINHQQINHQQIVSTKSPTNSVYFFQFGLTPDRACSQRSPFGAHARACPTRRQCPPGAFFVLVFSFEPLTFDTRPLAVRIPRLSAWRSPNSPKGISQRRILLPCLFKTRGRQH